MDLIVIIYLWLSLLFYLIFGGADFGAGIIEMFTSKRNRQRTRQTLYHAIGPIWEANHMWLIIAVVILFVGFPRIYSEIVGISSYSSCHYVIGNHLKRYRLHFSPL
jgi:cytochrome bd ubiquinol oxidase subunit II